MTYELAKQLKDAGFPQVMHYKAMGEHDGFLERDVTIDNHLIADPTLTELIDACGKNFSGVGKTVSGEFWAEGEGDDVSVVAPTPEEAVAKLWLALQPK
jgi:hypothetical protein